MSVRFVLTNRWGFGDMNFDYSQGLFCSPSLNGRLSWVMSKYIYIYILTKDIYYVPGEILVIRFSHSSVDPPTARSTPLERCPGRFDVWNVRNSISGPLRFGKTTRVPFLPPQYSIFPEPYTRWPSSWRASVDHKDF